MRGLLRRRLVRCVNRLRRVAQAVLVELPLRELLPEIDRRKGAVRAEGEQARLRECRRLLHLARAAARSQRAIEGFCVLRETAPWRNCSMATAAEVKRARRAKRAAATLDDPPPQPILRAASANDCVATKLGWLTQYQWGTADATAAPTVPEV